MEGGRRDIDLLFPFCGFVVVDILDHLRCFQERGCSFLPSILSHSLLCSLILSLDPQIGSRWNGMILLFCLP